VQQAEADRFGDGGMKRSVGRGGEWGPKQGSEGIAAGGMMGRVGR